MYLTKETKEEVFKDHSRAKTNTDTGSAEAQIALFSHRITHLTSHMQSNKKDYSTQQGLLRLVGKRRKLLNYLLHKDVERYRAVLADLKLRK
ncbi:MAG: 30S ribosomal protein S15 [Cyclobacteriaceae bacterium]|nr:30S ribosomal protein S15 [Cyclobacteriaceae bacterium]